MSVALDEITITMADVTRAGICARGAKGWFADNGLDFRDFLKNGISAARMVEVGDAHGALVVTRKIQRELVGVDLTGIVVTVDDSRDAGRCVFGSRQFASAYGLNFEDFLANGIPATVLVATGDPEALAVVRHKVRMLSNG